MLNINDNTKGLLLETLQEISNIYGPSNKTQEDPKQFLDIIKYNLLSLIENGLNINKQYKVEFDGEYKPELDFGTGTISKPNLLYYKIKLNKDLATYYAKLILLLTYLRKLDVLYRLAQGLPECLDFGAVSTSSGRKGGKTVIRTNQVYYQHFPLASYLRSTHSAVLFMPKQDTVHNLNTKEFYEKWYSTEANPGPDFDNIKHGLLEGLYPYAGITSTQAIIFRKMLKQLFAKSDALISDYMAILSQTPGTTRLTYMPLEFPENSGFIAFKERKHPLAVTYLAYQDHINNGIFNSKYGTPLNICSGPVFNSSVPEHETHSFVLASNKIGIHLIPQQRNRLFKKPSNSITPRFRDLRTLKYTIFDHLNNWSDNTLDLSVGAYVRGFENSINKSESMLPYLNFILWLLSGLKSIYPTKQGAKTRELGLGEAPFSDGKLLEEANEISNINLINDALLAGELSIAPILDSFFSLSSKHIPLNSAIQSTITSSGHSYSNDMHKHKILFYNEKSPIYTKTHPVPTILTSNITDKFIYHDSSYINPASFITNIHGLCNIEEVGSNLNPYLLNNIGVYGINANSSININKLLEILKHQVLRLGASGDRYPVVNLFKIDSISQILSTIRLPYNLYKLYGNLFYSIISSIKKQASSDLEILMYFKSLKPYVNNDLKTLKKSFTAYKDQDINTTISNYTSRRRQDYINYTAGFYSGLSKLSKCTPWPLDIDYQYGTVAASSGSPFGIFANGVPKKLFEYATEVFLGKKNGGYFKAPTLPGLAGPEPFVISYLASGERDNIVVPKIEGYEEDSLSIIDSNLDKLQDLYQVDKNQDIIAPNHFMRKFYTSGTNLLNNLGFEDIEDLNINNLMSYYTEDKIDIIASKIQENLYIQAVAFDPIYSIIDNILNNDNYIDSLSKKQETNHNLVLLNLLNNIMGNINRPVMPFSVSGIIANLSQDKAIKLPVPELIYNSAKTIAGGLSLPNTCAYILDGKARCIDKYIQDGYSEIEVIAEEDNDIEPGELDEPSDTTSMPSSSSTSNSRTILSAVTDTRTGLAIEV